MNLGDKIRELMESVILVTSLDNSVRVSTHCLYPSNGTVSVSVRKHFDSFVVSDDGDAIREAERSGLNIYKIDNRLKHLVKMQGLLVKNGAIYSPPIPLNAIPAVVLLVANASKEAANWMLGSIKMKGLSR